MPLIINGQPATAPGVDFTSGGARALPSAQLSPLSNAARVQLPVAVAASGLAQAYSPNTPTPPKPTLRAFSTAPSTPLAAQLIAQSPDISAEELQVFVARAPVKDEPKEPGEADYLRDMRIARGEISGTEKTPAAAKQATPAAPPATPQPAALAASTPLLMNTAQVPRLAKQLLSVLTPVGKKPGLGEARGTDAYRVAESRNFTTSFPASVSAVL